MNETNRTAILSANVTEQVENREIGADNEVRALGDLELVLAGGGGDDMPVW